MKETNINDLLNIIESYFVAESSENDKLENVESKEVDSKVELIRKQLKTISKTKLKYEEIINENSDYKYALDQSAIVAVTNLKGDIEYVNDTFCRISKFSREELIGQNQRIVSSGYHSRDFWKEMWSVIGHGRVWRNEIRNKAKDGSIYWVDTTIVPFTEESGRPKKYLAIRFDITNKKLKEMELEEALKEVSNYKYALDQSAIVAITDLKGDIEYVNDTFCKISKYERGELIGQNQRIVNSEYHSRDFWKQMWSTIGHGKVWRNEIRNKAKDGSIYWVDTTIVPFNDDKGRPKKYIAIRFDITNKKHKEMELEEALKEVSNYKYALDQSAIVAITDRKGDIEYVNDTFCKISKYNRKELIGQNQRIVNSGFHPWEFWKEMWMTIGQGQVWRSEIRNKAKDGSIYWVDTTIIPFNNESGRPEKYIAIRFDITKKKIKELELKEALKEVSNYKFALDQSAIVAITDLKGDIEYVNDTFCRISKYSRVELVGQNQRIVSSGYHSSEFWKEMWNTIGNGNVWRNEIRNRAKDGSIYWVDTTIIPFKNDKGRPDKYIAIRFDITEKKKRDEELANYRSQLEQANEALSKFSYTAAHDMKSPLNIATGFINLIEMEMKDCDNENFFEYLSRLKNTIDRTRRLINGILDYSKTGFSGMDIEEVDVNQVVDEIFGMHNSNNNLEITIAKSFPIVKYHKVALEQTFENLLSNAIKYNDKDICKVDIGFSEKDDYYVFSVSDNGPGVDDIHKERVFDLFENISTRAEDSSGIGLATVKKIVTELKGEIRVEDAEGGGAKFIFTILK